MANTSTNESTSNVQSNLILSNLHCTRPQTSHANMLQTANPSSDSGGDSKNESQTCNKQRVSKQKTRVSKRKLFFQTFSRANQKRFRKQNSAKLFRSVFPRSCRSLRAVVFSFAPKNSQKLPVSSVGFFLFRHFPKHFFAALPKRRKKSKGKFSKIFYNCCPRSFQEFHTFW